jgi:hypothetical protein
MATMGDPSENTHALNGVNDQMQRSRTSMCHLWNDLPDRLGATEADRPGWGCFWGIRDAD